MNATAVPAPAGTEGPRPTANDRLKGSFRSWFWASMTLATVAHIALFAFWPEMTAADMGHDPGELNVVEVMEEYDLPPEPEEIPKPRVPVATASVVDPNITMDPSTFAAYRVPDLPAPPDEITETATPDEPRFTPWTVKPDVKNRQEVGRALEREYPALLRDAGIGGTVNVWFFINEDGRVENTQVDQSSGHNALDEAALRVAAVFQFTPALNRDKRVPVWVSIAIKFEAK